ncbi:MAG: serine/threonine protein kinase, partial [Myxococcales bacterium]|nr:serine/threonine protein kinase [Myxococcales bacterium]
MRYCTTCGGRWDDSLLYCPEDGARTEELPDEAAEEEQDKLLGRVVDGRYRVDKKIGQGGMGNVYLATHVVLNRRFALKVLAGDMARDPEVVLRFQQEAQAASAIGQQNIIDISDFGQLPDGTAYFVMEYLDGLSLTDAFESQGGFSIEETTHIVRQIATALGAAHGQGIVHRDLKPDNIILVKREETDHFVKVLDFGIAKVGGAASKLTKTGVIFGTPHYMAPEQAAGQSIDHRADVYSLGIILYEMCVGKVPFDADTYMAILSKHMFEPPPIPKAELGERELGPFEGIVLRALAKKPEDRYASMDDLLHDLQRVEGGERVRADDAVRAALQSQPPPPGSEGLPMRRVPTFALVVLGLLLVGGIG